MDWQIFWTVLGGAFGGALIGALATILVTRMNHKHASTTWLKEQRLALYAQTCTTNFQFTSYFFDALEALEELEDVEKRGLDIVARDRLNTRMDASISKSRKNLFELREQRTRFKLLGSNEISKAYDAYYESIDAIRKIGGSDEINSHERRQLLECHKAKQQASWTTWESLARSDLGIKD